MVECILAERFHWSHKDICNMTVCQLMAITEFLANMDNENKQKQQQAPKIGESIEMAPKHSMKLNEAKRKMENRRKK